MTQKSLIFAAAVAGLAVLGSGTASTSEDTDGTRDAPLRCEIVAENARGMMQLQGLVHADRDVDGRYRLTVTSASRSGSTNISQGGNFSASEKQPATLGKVMLSLNDVYDVELEVKANGKSFGCSERFANRV